MNNNPKTVCVIGGGVVGLSTALALHDLGFKVIVLEASAALASGASAQNGGQLSYSYVDALGSAALLKQMPKLAAGIDPSFRVNLSFNAARVRWLAAFLKNCTSSGFERNTHALLALAVLSRTTLDTWREGYGLDFDYRRSGKMLLCMASVLKKHDKARALKSPFGIEQRVLTRAETLELEPFLKETNSDFSGAIYSPDDAVGNSSKFSQEAAQVLERAADTKIYLDEAVKSLTIKSNRLVSVRTNAREIEADSFVFCTGTDSVGLAAQWGEYLPIIPMAGYSLDIPDAASMPEISITDTASKTVICRVGNRIRFAGLADLGYDQTTRRKNRETMLKTIFTDLYSAATKIKDTGDVWIGARPMTPNGQPIIRPARISNAFLNCGHGMYGWTLAAGSGLVSAQQVQEHLTHSN